MRKILILAAGILLAPCVVNAQTSSTTAWPIAAGSRVRVVSSALGGSPQKGSVVAASADTLVFRSAADDIAVSIPTTNILKLQVAQGTHTRKARGAFYGLLIGVGTGAIVGAAAYKKSDCSEICIFPDSRAFDGAVVGTLFGIVGTIVGTIVGAHAVDTWVPVSLPGR